MNQFEQNFEKRKAKEINLNEIYKVIKKRIGLVFILTIIAAVVGYLQDHVTITPLYQTSSRVIIGADDQARTTLQVIVKDPTILDKVVQQLKLPMTSDALANEITVASIESSQVVSITVVNKDPKLAAQIANTTASVFKDEVPNIVGKDYVRLLSDAKVNPVPINPKKNNKIYMYTIVGFVLGIGLAFLLDSLDNTLRSEIEIERLLGLNVLGKVSKMNKRNVKKKKSKLNVNVRGETIDYK
ncbi:Wzz/FepE/Etk N-terminal domain-containing protein [Neobacillus sp. PS3-12]|uniref:YveK family protein n=1 Tax=Neobacillus sp. PS3-12 TaxID=3070677 RepID=UPI0027DF0549|nr:Wzz/FepE/Etk N-terminal domain-containing protein [Neobacillus sp. PS3-12]WML51581.1 Wzz/FepE/Etk N-terminal domain-containing protein [Neobacillus sp. PS3-12]